MTQSSRFFDSTAYTEAEWNEFHSWIMKTDGVLADYLNELAVIQNTPAAMNVVVSTGGAWVQGSAYKSTGAETMTIEAADPTNPRIDRIILRCSWSANSVILAVLKGTAAATPSAPALTQTAATWEILLANVAVAAGATSIVTANITSGREVAACNMGTMHIDADGDLDAANQLIHNLADPVSAQDAATMAWAAPKASPTFTGVPAAPTAAYDTDTTQIATTAFVQDAVIGIGSTASDTQKSIIATEVDTTTYSGYVYMEQILIPPQYGAGSVFRASVELHDAGQTCYAHVRSRTGAVLGTFATTTSLTYVTKTVDITMVVPGDAVQLWIYTAPAGGRAYAKNFKICGTDAAGASRTWA